VTEKEKVLNYLRDAGGSSSRSEVSIQVFRRNLSADKLNTLLNTILAGLVEVRDKKWTLTEAGWREANLLASSQDDPEPQRKTIPDDLARFKALARENPDASPQRLLQLAGRSLGDPLSWPAEWRESHPEWFLQTPRDWYAGDVELIEDYPARYPPDPLTTKDQVTRPTSEAAWFQFAMRSPGASLEPLAVEMPAFEVANVMRTCRKIGDDAATEIFGSIKIETARKLATI
jgi:hypothetical protein